MNITFKPYKKTDREALKTLCESAWDYKDYTTDEKTRKDLIAVDAYASLIGANYAEIAYEGDQVGGVLIGASKGLFSSFRKLNYTIKTYLILFRLIFFRKDSKRALKNFRKIDKIYKGLYKKTNKKYDAEVILFAVHASMRGKGVGKKLMNNYLEHLRHKGYQNVYLFTDTSCTYGFYDHMNFTREDEATTTLELLNEQGDLTAFIYSKNL